MVVTPPTTYKEWSDILETFAMGGNDQTIIPLMKRGSLSWQAGVAERFVKRFSLAINQRLERATTTFQKRMTQAHGIEGPMVQALLQIRKELILLEDAVAIEVLPEENRQQFIAMIQAQRNSMQESLLESAKSDRSGKIMSIVRNNKIN